MMRWRINGEEGALVAPDDRGLAYGDGLFETLAVQEEQALLVDMHLERLLHGCERLGWRRVPDTALIAGDIAALARGVERGVMKVIVTRGRGGRGYCPGEADPTCIVGLWPWPAGVDDGREHGIAVRTCTQRLARTPRVAGLKHLNRLEQVLARDEWREGHQEGLMLDEDGEHVVEGTMSNLFVVLGTQLFTPHLDRNGVAGIIRDRISAYAPGLGLSVTEARLSRDELDAAHELFVTNSIIGVWPVRSLDGIAYRVGPVARTILEELKQRKSIAYL